MPATEQRIKDIKEISIAIDTWDDIFSDFDPRPFDEKNLSEDFIAELKKRYRESRHGNFVINIYAPISLKDEKTEKKVTHRLKRHFKNKARYRQKEIARIRIKGVIFLVFGICFLGILTLVTYYRVFSDLAIEILGIILMPLGWFGIWEGFSKIVDTSPVFLREEIIFKKLSTASYHFHYLDDNNDEPLPEPAQKKSDHPDSPESNK